MTTSTLNFYSRVTSSGLFLCWFLTLYEPLDLLLGTKFPISD